MITISRLFETKKSAEAILVDTYLPSVDCVVNLIVPGTRNDYLGRNGAAIGAQGVVGGRLLRRLPSVHQMW